MHREEAPTPANVAVHQARRGCETPRRPLHSYPCPVRLRPARERQHRV